MSYLVIDVMAEYTDRSTGNRQIRAEIAADTAADLPANTTALTWLLGSHAKTVDTGDEYWIDSSGSWILQPSSAITGNYYTKAETEGRLSAHVCTCDTAGNVADKVATTSDDFVLREGAIISVKFQYTNSVTDNASHPVTLNVNNTGAYRIIHGGGGYIGTGNPNLFGQANLYINYVFCNNTWVWISISYDTPKMTQAQATAGTSTTSMLISPKIVHDSIIAQTTPLQTALTPLIDSGAKNRLKLTDTTTTTKQGVTITYNNDGTYTIDSAGSPSTGADFFYLARTSENPVFPADSVISGCSGGTDSTYRLQIAGTSIYQSNDPTTITADTSGSLIFYFASGQTFDNLILSPMICSKADYDLSPTFEPYCPTLAELYALVRSYHP